MQDRRAYGRRRPDRVLPARVVPLPFWPSQAVTLEDFSTTGVGIIGARPLLPETLFLLDLPGLAPIGGEVVRAQRRPDGLWVAGCVLLGWLDPVELELLER